MRITGILLLVAACITLGAVRDYFDREGVSLVSTFEPKIGGVYDE